MIIRHLSAPAVAFACHAGRRFLYLVRAAPCLNPKPIALFGCWLRKFPQTGKFALQKPHCLSHKSRIVFRAETARTFSVKSLLIVRISKSNNHSPISMNNELLLIFHLLPVFPAPKAAVPEKRDGPLETFFAGMRRRFPAFAGIASGTPQPGSGPFATRRNTDAESNAQR
jgi:hypothetical protein